MECWEIFGPKRDDVTWEWRRLHNEEFCDLYFTLWRKYRYLGDVIKKNELGGTCGTDVGQERCIRSFGGEIRRKENSWKTWAQTG